MKTKFAPRLAWCLALLSLSALATDDLPPAAKTKIELPQVETAARVELSRVPLNLDEFITRD